MNKKVALARLKAAISEGRAIVGGGAGSWITAKAETEAGCDVIIVYGTGKYRMAGRSSMAGRFGFGDANEIVYDMAKEIAHVTGDIPLVAGVALQDPHRDMERFFYQLMEAGYTGIQNIPGMGGMIQMEGEWVMQLLEEQNLGLNFEYDCLKLANKCGMLTTPYAYNLEQAIGLASIGCDMICMHAGLTAKGLQKTSNITPIDQCAENLAKWVEAIRKENPDTIILCHGGPISEPEDFVYMKKHVSGIDGFYGASSIERIPVENAFIKTMGELRKIRRTNK